MKNLIGTLLIFICFSTALAQQPDQALARVRYIMNHVRDTLDQTNPYQEEMLLVLGENAALFTSYDKIDRIAKMTEQLKEQAIMNGGNITHIDMRNLKRKTVTFGDFYTYAKAKKVYAVELLAMNKYIYDDTLSTINWKLTKDTANFSGISCFKATARFKGRNWIAWYAPSLPFANGPWKLNGLPGLIVEAYDDKKEIQYLFAGFEKVDATNVDNGKKTIMLGGQTMALGQDFYLGATIKLPTSAIKTTREKLIKLRDELLANPNAIAGAMQMNGTSVKKISGPTAANVKRNIYNNPIELPGKP